jgi:hypothetical protein
MLLAGSPASLLLHYLYPSIAMSPADYQSSYITKEKKVQVMRRDMGIQTVIH